MMYKVIFRKEVEKYIKKLDKPTRLRIRNAILDLAENPYLDINVKPLEGGENLFRKRVGDFRIIFSVENEQLVILIIKVSSRGDVYPEN
ncbi:type II toxin-antitoxin system RelE family toxin [Effusibacillus lacus]|nr:type II toxin-antitoxin system RelE/ParE family toxin [Effusibacillus lacus]TCS71123.1 mRNA interferase RelE/StbE [Effusibacillus lacus]